MINHFVHALSFAAEKHKNQRRKDAQITPYINHPIELVNVLVNEGGVVSWDILCAALLHDVIEDTEYTYENILTEFGETVAQYVWWLTKIDSLPTRAENKYETRLKLAKAPVEAQTIKLADLLDNTPSIIQYDSEFAKVYVPEKLDLLTAMNKGDKTLYDKVMLALQ